MRRQVRQHVAARHVRHHCHDLLAIGVFWDVGRARRELDADGAGQHGQATAVGLDSVALKQLDLFHIVGVEESLLGLATRSGVVVDGNLDV